MSIGRRYEELGAGVLRALVWLVAAIYLGRVSYDNTLYDLRQRHPAFYVLKTISISIVLAFVYWNVVVMPDRIAALIWTIVAFLSGMVFVFKFTIDTGAAQAAARDPLNRRRYADRLGEDARMNVGSSRSRDDPTDD